MHISPEEEICSRMKGHEDGGNVLRIQWKLFSSLARALSVEILRKEVIQPQVPLRLPCYDFTPVADPTVVSFLPCGLEHCLRAGFKRCFGIVHRHFDIVNGFFNRCRAGSIDFREAVRRRPMVMTINAVIFG